MNESEEKAPLSLSRVEKLIMAACHEGRFNDDFYFDEMPRVADRLFQDRKILLEAAKRAHSKMVPHSPQAVLLNAAIDQIECGWPKDEPTA